MGLVGVTLLVALFVTGADELPGRISAAWRARAAREHPPTSAVRWADLEVHATTAGTVSSSEQTTIECTLEAGETTILWILPEGTMVKKGEAICGLDAASFQEEVRLQQINVNAIRAAFRQAELDLDVSRMTVNEYREGILQQTLKTLKGQLAATSAERERAVDRLAWTQRMYEKGYQAQTALSSAEATLTKMDLTFQRDQTALNLFERFSAPITLKLLGRGVLSAEAALNYQRLRLEWAEERREYYQRQVDRCTIRAPHDGFLTYVTADRGRTYVIEPGISVRRRQRLFYLPDLGKMQVNALLHETVVRDIQPGMDALVHVEALPGRTMEGHVETIAPLATENSTNNVKYYVGIVKLDTFPTGLKPGMTAEVVITTRRTASALVIPANAWAMEDGQGICYVAGPNRIERRAIKVGKASRDLLEVIDGLKEGEQVVLEPGLALDPAAFPSAPKPATSRATAPFPKAKPVAKDGGNSSPKGSRRRKRSA
jgi:HlyD family secretion protein